MGCRKGVAALLPTRDLSWAGRGLLGMATGAPREVHSLSSSKPRQAVRGGRRRAL